MISFDKYKKYVNMDAYTKKSILVFMLMIFVIGGVFGFIYEEIFYLLESGILVKRGMTFGPWIPIYGFGAVAMGALTHRFRKNPWLAFGISAGTAGLLELVTGFLMHKLGNIRLWNYDVEKWNWGNIGGYVCIRSILFFGLSGLLLVYGLLPFLKFAHERHSKKAFTIIAIIASGLFFADFVISSILLWGHALNIF